MVNFRIASAAGSSDIDPAPGNPAEGSALALPFWRLRFRHGWLTQSRAERCATGSCAELLRHDRNASITKAGMATRRINVLWCDSTSTESIWHENRRTVCAWFISTFIANTVSRQTNFLAFCSNDS
jgi:hypothetical protein